MPQEKFEFLSRRFLYNSFRTNVKLCCCADQLYLFHFSKFKALLRKDFEISDDSSNISFFALGNYAKMKFPTMQEAEIFHNKLKNIYFYQYSNIQADHAPFWRCRRKGIIRWGKAGMSVCEYAVE